MFHSVWCNQFMRNRYSKIASSVFISDTIHFNQFCYAVQNRGLRIFSTYHIKAGKSLQQFAVAVFQPMSLINDCYTPVDFPQLLEVRDDHFIGRDQHMETEYIGNRMTLTNSNFQHISTLKSKNEIKLAVYMDTGFL